MSEYTPACLRRLFALGEALEIPARELARVAAQAWRAYRRRPRGATLRPGPDTPLWNALAAAVRPRLRRRGARVLLAHELGVPRARITEYFVKGTAMPDAERALLLLLWMSRRATPRLATGNFPPAGGSQGRNVS